MIVRSIFRSLKKHLIPLEIRAMPSLDKQTAFTASPTVTQTPNAEMQTQAQNIEAPTTHQTLGRARHKRATHGELARKYRS